jgi:hypothetical protein
MVPHEAGEVTGGGRADKADDADLHLWKFIHEAARECSDSLTRSSVSPAYDVEARRAGTAGSEGHRDRSQPQHSRLDSISRPVHVIRPVIEDYHAPRRGVLPHRVHAQSVHVVAEYNPAIPESSPEPRIARLAGTQCQQLIRAHHLYRWRRLSRRGYEKQETRPVSGRLDLTSQPEAGTGECLVRLGRQRPGTNRQIWPDR